MGPHLPRAGGGGPFCVCGTEQEKAKMTKPRPVRILIPNAGDYDEKLASNAPLEVDAGEEFARLRERLVALERSFAKLRGH